MRINFSNLRWFTAVYKVLCMSQHPVIKVNVVWNHDEIVPSVASCYRESALGRLISVLDKNLSFGPILVILVSFCRKFSRSLNSGQYSKVTHPKKERKHFKIVANRTDKFTILRAATLYTCAIFWKITASDFERLIS